MFLDDYVKYASEICYAPEIYHRVMARVLVGMACRNKAYVLLGNSRIFLNFWVIILGLSSTFHKSTSIKNALDIMDRIDEGHRFLDAFTPEGLIPFLSRRPSCTYYVDEFDTLQQVLKKDYMGGGEGMLRTLYDVPPVWKKALTKDVVKGKAYEVRFPTMTIPAATTPSILMKNIQESDIESGWLVRWLIVFAKEKNPRANDWPPDVDENKKNEIVKSLNDIRNFMKVNIPSVIDEDETGHVYPDNDEPAQIKISPEIHPIYKKWADKIETEMIKDRLIAPMLSRLTIYAIKLSAIEAVADFSQTVELKHWERAMGMVEFLHGSIFELMHNEFTFTEFQGNMKKIMDEIEAEPAGITRTRLLRKVRIPGNQLDDIMRQLLERKVVDEIEKRVENVDKPTKYYVKRDLIGD